MREEYKPHFWVSGFRYVLVENWTEEVKAENFTGIAVYSDIPFVGTFTCSNPLVNQLVENVRWSQKGNFVDIPADCPTRERSGWTADMAVFCETACYLSNPRKFLKKWLQDYKAEQGEDGNLPYVVPAAGKTMRQRGCMGWSTAIAQISLILYRFYGEKEVYTELINRHISDPEQHLKVFDKNSVYLPTKKIGKNNPKAAEIEADNAARQEWNKTADMALLSGISEAKIIEVKQTEIHDKVNQSVRKSGWLPNLFRRIVSKAKEFLQNLIREHEMPPKPTLSINMTEFRTMRNLMIQVQDEARAIRSLQEEVPKLKEQLSEAERTAFRSKGHFQRQGAQGSYRADTADRKEKYPKG